MERMSGLLSMTAVTNGLIVEGQTGALINGSGTDIEFGAGLIFASNGRVVDPVTLTAVTALP